MEYPEYPVRSGYPDKLSTQPIAFRASSIVKRLRQTPIDALGYALQLYSPQLQHSC